MSTDPDFAAAAPAAESAAGQVEHEDLLKCQICNNDYHLEQSKSSEGDGDGFSDHHDRSPVTFTCCGNTVCFGCAERYRASRSSQLKDIDKRRKRIECMLCRQLFPSRKDFPYLKGKIAVGLEHLSPHKRRRLCGESISDPNVEQGAESSRRLFASISEKVKAAKARQGDAEREKEETGAALQRAKMAHQEAQLDCEEARESVLAAKQALEAAKEALNEANKSLERTEVTLGKARESDDYSRAKLDQANDEARDAVAKAAILKDTLRDFVDFDSSSRTDPVCLEGATDSLERNMSPVDQPGVRLACAENDDRDDIANTTRPEEEAPNFGFALGGVSNSEGGQTGGKCDGDITKYKMAELLCKNVAEIRASYTKDLRSKDPKTRQLATVAWIVDRLALYTFMRFGRYIGEKSGDPSLCSLRVEDIKFHERCDDEKVIQFNFLNNSSEYCPLTINFSACIYTDDDESKGETVWKNLRKFCKKKELSEKVFDTLNPSLLDEYLESMMTGLTAEVFLVYNASKKLQHIVGEIEENETWKSQNIKAKMSQYKSSIRAVITKYDHRKYASNAKEMKLMKWTNRINTLRDQKLVLQEVLRMLKKGESTTHVVSYLKNNWSFVKKKAEEASCAVRADALTEQQVGKRLHDLSKKIKKMNNDIREKSYNNWMGEWAMSSDPRIIVAWCRRNNIPVKTFRPPKLSEELERIVSSEWKFDDNV